MDTPSEIYPRGAPTELELKKREDARRLDPGSAEARAVGCPCSGDQDAGTGEFFLTFGCPIHAHLPLKVTCA